MRFARGDVRDRIGLRKTTRDIRIGATALCSDRNAPMESFFHTLKTELVHHRQYATRAEATRDPLPTSKASTTELGAIPPSVTSARSRWS
jgi:transposase InsO family protein